jgi:hypothetical protein
MTSPTTSAGDQLELSLGVEDLDAGHARWATGRTCPICGAALDDQRRDAVYCGGPCRAEASRVRRLREGQAVDGYSDLAGYSARHRRTRLNGVLG